MIPEGVEIPQDPQELYDMLQENPSYSTAMPTTGITGTFCVRHAILD